MAPKRFTATPTRMSAFQVRAVPFFAVVAGPIMAHNLQEWLAWLSASRKSSTPAVWWHPAAGRALGLTAALLLVACAWPGWLQAPPYEPRRWALATPASLEAAALANQRMHQEGRLRPASRALHLSPETAHAFAWFCPEEQGILDPGLSSNIRGEAGTADDWAGNSSTTAFTAGSSDCGFG